MVKLWYESSADAAWIDLGGPGPTVIWRRLNGEIVADLDDNGELLALAVHANADASHGLGGPDAQQRAEELVEWALEQLASAPRPA